MASQIPANERRLIPEPDAARYLGMSRQYLRASRVRGATTTTAPPYVRIGRAVRYDLRDLDAWIDARRVSPGRRGAA